MGNTYIVAEIGTAHGGDLGRARELIHSCHESGADCAKFQYVLAHELVHPNVGDVLLPGGAIPLFHRFQDLEQSPEFYAELKSLCEAEGIDFLCTPFGVESARQLHALGVENLKIASPETNHTELLTEIASFGLPLIVSTGVTTLGDIEYTLSLLGRTDVTLLHCVTAYPAPEEDFNLSVIPKLSGIFGVPVGISDHSQDPSMVPGLAVALGATIVEKHFTLARTGNGLDDPIAMDPDMFTRMAATIRRVDAVLSLDEVRGSRKVIEEFGKEYGVQRVTRVLGRGVKQLSPAERDNYSTTNRSILATRDLKSGEVIGDNDIAALRSEKNLPPGLAPRHLQIIRGAVLAADVPAGHGIQWEHIIRRPG